MTKLFPAKIKLKWRNILMFKFLGLIASILAFVLIWCRMPLVNLLFDLLNYFHYIIHPSLISKVS